MKRLRLALLATLLASSAASAQGLPDPVLGALTPDNQSARVDDAWSLLSNPAGLAGVERFQLVGGYTGRYSVVPEDHFHLGLASRAFGPLVIGGQLGWRVTPDGADARFKSTAALALEASRAFRVGARLHGISALAPGAETHLAWDLGVQARPASWLALGVELETLGAQLPLRPGARAGVSVRPFGELLTLGADARFTSGSDDYFDADFLGAGVVSPAVNARLDLGGFAVAAGAVFPGALSGGDQVELGVSLIVDAAHAGASFLGGWRTDNQITGGAFGRVSSEAFDSVFAGEGQWIGLALTGPGVPEQREDGLAALFASAPRPERVLAALARAEKDPAIEGVVLRLRGLTLGWGRAAELRDAMRSLRAAGKRVVVHLDAATDRDLYLATAADQIFVSPAAYLAIDGLRIELVYFEELLDQLGIRARAFVAGDYKSGPRPFTHSEPSPEQLEVQNALLDALYGALISAIVEGRGLSEDDAKAALDQGGLTPDEALERKLIDDILYADELEERLSDDQGHRVSLRGDYLRQVRHVERWQDPPRVAIVPVVGEIRAGRSGNDLLSGAVAGADDVIAALEQAAKDPSIRAVVLRVDSPGGDALASDLIWHAVRRVQAKKPVVASMGDVAASGGYYIAAGAKLIYAEPETLTGSIGVYSVAFEGSRAADELGVRAFELQRGALPGGTLFRPYTEAEAARAQALVESAYARFQTAIRDGRDIDAEALLAVAGGRVWMGAKAKEIGLVDELGGLSAALDKAKALAELEEAETVILTAGGGPPSPLELMTRGEDPRAELRRLVRLVIGDAESLGALRGADTPQARMPLRLRIE